MLYPFAPHISEELNQLISKSANQRSLQFENWPSYHEALTIDQTVEIVVQVNGKVKGKLTVDRDSAQASVQAEAVKLEPVKQLLANETIKRAVFVPNKLINLVI